MIFLVASSEGTSVSFRSNYSPTFACFFNESANNSMVFVIFYKFCVHCYVKRLQMSSLFYFFYFLLCASWFFLLDCFYRCYQTWPLRTITFYNCNFLNLFPYFWLHSISKVYGFWLAWAKLSVVSCFAWTDQNPLSSRECDVLLILLCLLTTIYTIIAIA